MGEGISRRRFLGNIGAVAGMTAIWQPVRKLRPLDRGAGDLPPGFPAGIDVYRRVFENWAQEIRVDDVWTCAPRSAHEVVTIANWAAAHGWRVRPTGAKHGWVPTTVLPDQPAEAEVVLLDMRAHLNKVLNVSKSEKTFSAQAGTSMDVVMDTLERNGMGMTSIPAPGDVTLGGVLAISGHGAALPALGEDTTGRSYGSLSNRVLSMTVVGWDAAKNAFTLQTFNRSNPTTNALLVSLGRVMLISATLRAETNVNLQCKSITDIPASELFSAPGTKKARSFASYVDVAGRVEAIWFTFSDAPWLKYWKVAPTKPASSRAVTKPYNYVFSDSFPTPVARVLDKVIAGNGAITPQFGQGAAAASAVGLRATDTDDIWGPSRATLHYIKPTTLRATDWGWAVITKRANIQRVAHEFYLKHNELVDTYRARGLYPQNISFELRCTTVDDPSSVGLPEGTGAPTLSVTAPRADHPEWDTAIWLNLMGLPRTPGAFRFRRDLERWLFSTYTGDYATVRAEWTKNWGYTDQGSWKNPAVLHDLVPNSFRTARPANANWDWAVARMHELDPHHVFSNDFLDDLLR